MLTETQSVTLNAVVERTIEKLIFLGESADSSEKCDQGRRERFLSSVGNDVSDILRQQASLLQLYEDAIKSPCIGSDAVCEKMKENNSRLQINLGQRPDLEENLKKVDRERKEIVNLLKNLGHEIVNNRGISDFAKAVEDCERTQDNQLAEKTRLTELEEEICSFQGRIRVRHEEYNVRRSDTSAELGVLEALSIKEIEQRRCLDDYISAVNNARAQLKESADSRLTREILDFEEMQRSSRLEGLELEDRLIVEWNVRHEQQIYRNTVMSERVILLRKEVTEMEKVLDTMTSQLNQETIMKSDSNVDPWMERRTTLRTLEGDKMSGGDTAESRRQDQNLETKPFVSGVQGV